jgi:hypothetical protein
MTLGLDLLAALAFQDERALRNIPFSSSYFQRPFPAVPAGV